jgi:KDO2-lipid IV(A) lauroyltransferase
MFISFLLDIVAFLLSLLGFQGISIVSQLCAFLVFDVLRIRRSVILQNLNLVFGNTKTFPEKKMMARKSIASFVATSLEFIASKHLFPKAKVTFIHPEYIQNALKKNEGMYSICLHMSNWEFLCHANSVLYGPVHVVVKKISKGAVEDWIQNLRRHIGYALISREGGHRATTQLFQCIENKGIIGFIADQKRPKGEKLPFFGKIASTNNSLAKLYLRKKAPIIAAIIKRKKPGEFEITYYPEFEIKEDPSLSHAQIVTENTLRMNQLVEKMILENPEEYFWMHNRWDFPS